jgi:membrane-bound ClpP family serine protease
VDPGIPALDSVRFPGERGSPLTFGQRKKLYLAAYILIGIVTCLVVASRKGGADQRSELPLSVLFDPVWLLVLLWPVWIGVVLVERSFPKESSPVSSPAFNPVGHTGQVAVALRPMGKVQIGALYFDARSAGGVIPEGATVRVLARSMSELLVEEAPNQGPGPKAASDRDS